MRIDEFEEILKVFPNLKGVVLCGMYEPLSDYRIGFFLNSIENIHPQADVTIFTNGSLLDQAIAHILLNHENLKNVVISIHGYSSAVYESVMKGLDRDVVYRNVLNFIQEAKTRKTAPRISVSFVRVKQNIHELQAFREFWKDKADNISDFEVMNWRGQVNEAMLLYETPKHTRPCPMYEQPLVIDAYGQIVRCCYDFTFNYGHVLADGLKNWKNKVRMSETYPTDECKTCLGWKHY